MEMSNSPPGTVQAIVVLDQKTQEGAITWALAEWGEWGDDLRIRLFLVASHGGKILGLYEGHERHWDDEEEWHWEELCELAILDEEHKRVWPFPRHGAVVQLMNTAKRKVVGADDYIQQLLEDPEDE